MATVIRSIMMINTQQSGSDQDAEESALFMAEASGDSAGLAPFEVFTGSVFTDTIG